MEANVANLASLVSHQLVQRTACTNRACLDAEMAIGKLIEDANAGCARANGFSETSQLIEAVLLPIDDYWKAIQHLRNASSYCCCGERGASCFELRQVRSLLASL